MQNYIVVKNKSFTFIELLFVITIMGVLVGISLPRLKNTFDTQQLTAVGGEFQSFVNYLCQRSVMEGKIIYLYIDNQEREYWAEVKEVGKRLKTYHLPQAINLESEQEKIGFYPDGSIDKISIRIVSRNQQALVLTTKGVFGGIKLEAQK